MATIKSYTDIEQSKKLAEILPIESSDMYWDLLSKEKYAKVNNIGHCLCRTCVYAWSLAALLGVLPNDTSLLYFDDTYQMVYDKKPYVISNKFDNPVDACCEMIEKLHELNLL